jgi:Cu2+-exporting ATPase
MSEATSGLCSHCRLPLPTRPYREDGAAFCCIGCLTVFRLVGATGEAGQAGWFLAKLGLAATLSGNVMLFQSLLYVGSLQSLGPDVLRTSSWIMLGLSVAVYLLLGVPLMSIALRAAREGRLVLETLIGVGAFVAILASAIETARGGSRLYYDSGTMLLVLVVLGQYLDAVTRQKASETLQPVLAGSARQARVIRHGSEEQIAPEDVARGERVRVRAGEEIPVDGEVLEGRSDVHDPALTGESAPRLVAAGDRVLSGSVALDGALLVAASGESETLARRIERWVAKAKEQRAPVELAADRYVSRFISGVVLVALTSACGWGLSGHWETGGLAALSVLVVACPCALGIATPMATTIALSRAASRGILVRTGSALEALGSLRQVVFDKTGTLTTGHPVVDGVRSRSGFSEREAWALAAALEGSVDHPFARAIVQGTRGRGIPIPEVREVRAIPGGGVEGLVDGRSILLGSRALLEERGVHGLGEGAGSFVGVAVDGVLKAEFRLDDPARDGAREALEELQGMGIGTALVSGDEPRTVGRIAQELGLETAVGGLGPKDKPEAIRHLGAPKAMVGDGINDGPALAAAEVGIAFGARATDVAKGAADVVILSEDLRHVPWLLQLARRTMSVVRQNLLWAFGYNTVGIGLAAFGLLRPVFAAGAMVLSSLFVVGNSLRLRSGPSSASRFGSAGEGSAPLPAAGAPPRPAAG